MDRIAYGALRRGLCLQRAGLCDVTAANVRNTFLEYFQRDHNHLLIPSSSVQPKMDPTVSFVVSGMNQFKDVFLGVEVPAAKRVVNSQKCIRIKGKYNDLSQVGLDGTHHTFFEMLGNWSFQDYFKKEACLMSWKLLTEVYGLPPERLYVTYFNGDDSLGLSPDLETREIWREIGVPENKILPFGMSDNFWEMGDVGPCGPATEIHYDHVPGRQDASALVNSGDPLVTELWNIVFIEFERAHGGDLRSLGKKFVDTGMGFERLVAIMQGQTSNYETDLFRPLFAAITRISGVRGYHSSYEDDVLDRNYRILADHVRMLTVALGDGMTPYNHYRLRTIFRKVFEVQRTSFKMKTGLVKQLSNHVAEMLSPVYPEIGRNLDKIHWIIDEEEDSFNKRWEQLPVTWKELMEKHPRIVSIGVKMKEEFVHGFRFLEKMVLDRGEKKISGELAYKLYETYGMTPEVLKKLAIVLGLSFNADEYEEYSKQKSEASRVTTQEKLREQKKQPVVDVPVCAERTDDSLKYEYEVDMTTGNYQLPEIPVNILYALVDGKVVESVKPENLTGDRRFGLVFDRTAMFHKTDEFASDKGVLTFDDTVTLRIFSVEKIRDHLIHYAYFETSPESYDLPRGKTGILRVSGKVRRGLMRANSTALVVKSFLNKEMKIFSEIRSDVEPDSFKLVVMGHPLSMISHETLRMEVDISEALMTGEKINRKWCTVQEIRDMENLVRRAGDTFIEEKTPIASVPAIWGVTRFRCPGPIVKHLSEVEHFAIVDVESSYRVKTIHCVTGPKAAEVKANNASIAEKWREMRDFHIIADVEPEAIKKGINIVQNFLKKVRRPGLLSYYIRTSILEEAFLKISRIQGTTRSITRSLRKAKKKTINS